MTNLYSTIVSEKLVPTVNFYEDFFGFVPAIEKEGYVLLRSAANDANCIAIFDVTHKCVAEDIDIKPVQGVIINVPVKDVEGTYNRLYMEGLDMYKTFGRDINGKQHFVVRDPNGVLVNVHEPFEARELELV